MPCKIFSNPYFRTEIPVLTRKFRCIAWDAYFYIGTPILIVKMGGLKFTVCMGHLFSQHIYCENGHPGAYYIHVNIGIGMLIFT